MHQNKSVDVHKFTMIPNSDIPRSKFVIEKTHKTTFDSGYLIPIYIDEVLPGDTFNLRMTAFGRLATPIVPIMDNIYLDTFFFFVPNRLVWDNWQRFMGEQDNPDDSISYLVPCFVTGTDGIPVGSIGDYMGLPTEGQASSGLVGSDVIALPFRAYNLIWNEWFRDENLQDSVEVPTDDGPDNFNQYTLLRRGKRKDYFTGALPWPVKGGVSVPLPLGDRAPIIGLGTRTGVFAAGGTPRFESTGTTRAYTWEKDISPSVADQSTYVEGTAANGYPAVFADLSEATAATINQLRQAFQIQKLLERDARGGTRYTELLRAHFGVTSPDARLQRPEYLGGGTQRIAINPIAQTSATDSGGGETPQGNLAAMGTVMAHNHGFQQSFTEHGYIIGLAMVRADLTYQQGLRKMWSRRTRYDFYWPAFAMLGEQAVLNKEIYYVGSPSQDNGVFGYQERWAEYRYNPSQITGLFRSTSAGTIDIWHVAQRFNALPTLNDTFIEEHPPIERILAVGAEANGQQIILDAFFRCNAARPLPMYSVPGLIDHF